MERVESLPVFGPRSSVYGLRTTDYELPTTNSFTAPERRALSVALDGLPPLHQHILRQRLRAIYFVDAPAMTVNALTNAITVDEPYLLFDINHPRDCIG